MIPGSANPLLLAPAGGGYQVERSLRFNSSDSAYLSQGTSRTPAANTSITFSFWLKLSSLSTDQQIIWSNPAAGFLYIAYWGSYQNGALWVGNDASGLDGNAAKSNGVLRDPSAWYHILYSRAHGSNGILYINGVQQTTQAINTANVDFFADSTRSIGRRSDDNSRYASLYLADFHCIDGQALTPSSFTEVSATTGQLIPKAYSGSFGTNGFWLKFSDNSAATAATLGKDYSGNSNNWTPNNLSVTAGAGNDSLVDTPTSIPATDTGVGGEIRGNYCTINRLDQRFTDNGTISNGNLDYVQSSTGARTARGSIGVSSGKWYWEFTSLGGNLSHGISKASSSLATYPGGDADGWSWFAGGGIYNNGGTTGAYSSSTYTTNDVIGVALDLAAGTLVYYKNGVSQGTAASGLSGTWFPAFGSSNTVVISFNTNFGQRAFAYPLSGFKALVDTNLPTPVVAKPNTVMDVALYTGNGSTQTISGLAFSPDLVWIKNRTSAYNHGLWDTVRGATNALYSSLTDPEGTESGVSAFNSDGFSVGSSLGFNKSSDALVAWAWDAGTSTVSNTAGSITSQVRANASAGFSIVSYAGSQGSTFTVGHGLNVQPAFVITKARNANDNWGVYYTNNGINTNYLLLNSTAAQGTNNGPLTGGAYMVVSSTTLQIASTAFANGGSSMIAYCFAPVVGYSSFGSYTGNGSSDGPFVYTGFRPRWVLVKCSSLSGGSSNWVIHDTSRDASNVMNKILLPNLFNGELTNIDYQIDTLSNGFKIRNTNSNWNASSATYVYAAFAENPFQYARAR